MEEKEIKHRNRKYRDLTGVRFGRLTVMHLAYKVKRPNDFGSRFYWHCKCDCGNEIDVRGDSLKDGSVSSCKCLKKEIAIKTAKAKKIYNKYDLSGEYGIGYNFDGRKFYFDKEDYNLIKDYHWYIDEMGYVKTCVGDTTMRIHTLIKSCQKGKIIDHINGIRIDNRKKNLREVSYMYNSWNKRLNSNNTSGYTGVYKNKNGKYNAKITCNYKDYNLGVYETYEEAMQVRKESENELYGKYSYNNSRRQNQDIKEIK